MPSNYRVYPVYGKDGSRLILGISKLLDSKKCYYHGEVIEEAASKCGTNNFIVIDWKRYQVKYHLNRCESNWCTFKSNEFWQRFRFTSPCEESEIRAYGNIR